MKKIYTLFAAIFSTICSFTQVNYVSSGSTSAEVLSGNSLSINTTPPSTANCTIIAVSEFQKSYPATVTDVTSSRNFTLAKTITSSGGSLVAIYYLTNPGTGSHTVTVSTGAGNNANIKAVLSYYSGVNTQSPIANTGSASNPSGNLDDNPELTITSSAGYMVVDAIVYEKTGTPQLEQGQIQIASNNLHNWTNGSSNKSGASSVYMQWDFHQNPGSYWGIVLVSLKSASALPITLTDFTAQYNKTNVTLAWKSSQEINFSHYILEHSTDGNVFTTTSMIFGAGVNNGGAQYSYVDRTVTGRSGLIYYRLKMVDIDGKFTYSPTRVIRLGDEPKAITLTTYPNPVISEVRITLPSSWQNKEVNIDLYNTSGQKIKSIKSSNSSQTETIAVAELGKGVYVVNATCGTETAQQKIIKN
jgi:hypothetical protein